MGGVGGWGGWGGGPTDYFVYPNLSWGWVGLWQYLYLSWFSSLGGENEKSNCSAQLSNLILFL